MSDETKLRSCGVRDGGDFWHLECRFEDGQKFAAVQVDKAHEKLADEIAAYLNTRERRVAQLEAELQELSAARDKLEACPFCAVPRCAARCQLLG